jgi:hypothetical protein
MGLQVSCGDWHAADDAGDAFDEVLRGVEGFLTEEESEDWANELLPSLEEQDAAIDPEDCETNVTELSPRLMDILIGPLRRYHAHLAELLGHPDPSQARAREWEQGILGDGARLECAHALIEAYWACRRIGQPVRVIFS